MYSIFAYLFSQSYLQEYFNFKIVKYFNLIFFFLFLNILSVAIESTKGVLLRRYLDLILNDEKLILQYFQRHLIRMFILLHKQ